MTQMQNKIRYVHEHAITPVSQNSKFGAYTVAYHRCEDGVVFAYALCNRKDEFVKSVGREIADYRLEANYALLHNEMVRTNDFGFNPHYHVGFISSDAIRHHNDVTNMIADHVDMSAMDYKHSFISNVLRTAMNEVLDYLEG